MNSVFILKILSSKPHNKHALYRYVRFIKYCASSIRTGCYTERHHICPKAKDLFPEYSNFQINPWNMVTLTYRQHFIAHRMLSRVYGKSQVKAFYYMCNNTNRGLRNIPIITSKSYSLLKEQNQLVRQLDSRQIYLDRLGNKVWTSTSDSRILSGELVHFMVGRKRSRDSILRQIESSKRTYANNPDILRDRALRISNTKRGVVFSDDHRHNLSISHKGLSRSKEAIHKTSQKLKGRARPPHISKALREANLGFMSAKDYNGNTFRIRKDDPKVLSGEYIGNASKPRTYKDVYGNEYIVLRNHPNVVNGTWFS